MQALKHGLGTLPKTLAFFIELTKNFKPRFFFCLAALNGSKLLLHASDTLLMVSQRLLATLNSAPKAIEFVLKVLGRRACSVGVVLDSGAGRLYVGNRGI